MTMRAMSRHPAQLLFFSFYQLLRASVCDEADSLYPCSTFWFLNGLSSSISEQLQKLYLDSADEGFESRAYPTHRYSSATGE